MGGAITSAQYADMAFFVYNIDATANPLQGGDADSGSGWLVPEFEAGLFEYGMAWGATRTDFKGCVYASRILKEAVVAFQGTVLSKGGDLVADLQVALGMLTGMLPQYCNAALKLVRRTQAVYPQYAISFVGHSLGGALAQVMGHWTGRPFVTFNAPGMWSNIQVSKFLSLWSPLHSVRSIAGTFEGSLFAKQMALTGRNFRNVFDPVSSFGSHYGPVTRFWGSGFHEMADIRRRVRESAEWADVNPFDPDHKEWGEW